MKRYIARAFTLIEMIVVISLIALLIALLLPALSKAREAGRAITCSTQMRQLGMATFVYSTDSDGWLPAATTSRYSPTAWEQTWLHRLIAIGALKPGKSVPAGASAGGRFFRPIHLSYMTCPSRKNVLSPLDKYLYQYNVPQLINGYDPSGNGSGWGGNNYRMSQVDELAEASRTLMLNEVGGAEAWLMPFWMDPSHSFGYSAWAAPHQGANFLFQDGHVQRHRYEGRDANLVEQNGWFHPLDFTQWAVDVSPAPTDLTGNDMRWSRMMLGLDNKWNN